MKHRDGERMPRIFSTCPPVAAYGAEGYADRVSEVARWSEDHGCTGMLIYADNRQIDPWLVSQIVLSSTETLLPLPAVQPVYMHPFTVAKRLADFGHLFGRRFVLNMVAGGFRNDLTAMGDRTEHDRRYDRLVEYTRIVLDLLRGEGPVTLEGDFYDVRNLTVPNPLPESLVPEIFLAGSSEAGREAARVLDATPVKYPEPPGDDAGSSEGDGSRSGIRVGIIAREDAAEAWAVAHRLFPPDREGQLAHQLAMRVSDSEWHEKLSGLSEDGKIEESPYWLVPFENYKTFCPYLVGSHDQVATEISRYLALGYDTFILDVPFSETELRHTAEVFSRATEGVVA